MFLDRCIDELSICIGLNRAETVCEAKWEASKELGKKGFVNRSALSDDDLAIEPCGKQCLACAGAHAPWTDIEIELRDWDESKHPREPAGSPQGGQFTGGGGGDDDLGSMALGGEDRNITASTRKVDKLRDEMGVVYDDLPLGQRQALDMYTLDSFDFNQRARQHGTGPVGAWIENLDGLVTSHTLPHDVTVYRTVGWQRTQAILNHEKGDAFSDAAFMSTTLDKSKIDRPGSYIEIQVPKGSRAFPVGSLSNFPEEAEILFPRDSRLEIISHEARDAPNTMRFVARLVS
jgi:hypothetical protein